jgi:hypothetical protein
MTIDETAYTYCLQLTSYDDLYVYSGDSDYMQTHEYPFLEFEIDKNITLESITDILKYTYDTICDYGYEQLAFIPTSV